MSDFKVGVARQFDRAAGTYDRYAEVQGLMSKRLIARLAEGPRRYEAILELGCGTGALTAGLASVYPEASITALDLSSEMVAAARARPGTERVTLQVADAETAIWPPGSFDLIVSSATIQWFEDPASTVQRLAEALEPGGSLLHSTFGPATFGELNDVMDSIEGTRPHGLPLAPAECWLTMLKGAGLIDAGFTKKIESRCYPDLSALLRSIKGIGAAYAHGAGQLPWERYRRLKEAIELYDRRYASPGGVRVTYELLELWGVRNNPNTHSVRAG